MKHRVFAKSNLGRHTSHRLSMFRTMITQLFMYEGIKTTAVKMKRIKPLADKMVTLGKKGTLHHRRQVAAFVRDDLAYRRVTQDYPERYKARQGGYTTFVRLPARRGDGAPMVYLMMVDSNAHKLWKEVAKRMTPVNAKRAKDKA